MGDTMLVIKFYIRPICSYVHFMCECSLGLFSRSSAVVMRVGIWLANSLWATETHSEFRYPSQPPPGSFTKRGEKKKKAEGGGWGGHRKSLQSASRLVWPHRLAPLPPSPKSEWTQQMFMEVESRDGGGGVKMTAVHCLSTPAIVRIRKWRGGGGQQEEREKREGIVDYWCSKLHFVQAPWQKGQ